MSATSDLEDDEVTAGRSGGTGTESGPRSRTRSVHGAGRRPSPGCTTSAHSAPWHPAFMKTPPPTVPGTPTILWRPAESLPRPCDVPRAERREAGARATNGRPATGSGRGLCRDRMTRASRPASGRRTFEPRPHGQTRRCRPRSWANAQGGRHVLGTGGQDHRGWVRRCGRCCSRASGFVLAHHTSAADLAPREARNERRVSSGHTADSRTAMASSCHSWERPDGHLRGS